MINEYRANIQPQHCERYLLKEKYPIKGGSDTSIMLTFYSSFKLFIDTSRYIHAVILLQVSRLNNDEVEPNVITFIVRKVSCSEDFKRSTVYRHGLITSNWQTYSHFPVMFSKLIEPVILHDIKSEN